MTFEISGLTSTALKSQKAVSACFKSNQILPFGFARQTSCRLVIIMWRHGIEQHDLSCVFYERERCIKYRKDQHICDINTAVVFE